MPHIAEERMDNVNGIVVGGDYIAWQLFYGGRPQGGKQYADDEAAALRAAEMAMDTLKAFSAYPLYLYPDKTKWEIRLWP